MEESIQTLVRFHIVGKPSESARSMAERRGRQEKHVITICFAAARLLAVWLVGLTIWLAPKTLLPSTPVLRACAVEIHYSGKPSLKLDH